MKLLMLTADAVHDTWSKTGVLFSSGLLIIQWANFCKPVYTSTTLTPEQVQQVFSGELVIGWGKGFANAPSDYQYFRIDNAYKPIEVSNEIHAINKYIGNRTFSKAGGGGDFKNAKPIKDICHYV